VSTALLCEGAALSRAELESWASSLAGRVLALGDPTERTVGILAPSSLEFVAALRGIWKAGAIAVPLQAQHPVAELEYLVADARLAHAFVHPACEPLAAKLGLAALPLARTAGAAPPAPPRPEHGALMIYTSGTTSRPKGVVTTYGGLAAQVASLREAWRWEERDKTLCVLPLHHVHGLVNVLTCALESGASCELTDRFSAALVWERMPGLTVFMAVPTVYTKLIEHWEKQDAATRARWGEAARGLRLMVSGSAALPAPVSDKWLAISGHRLLERYGMTEIGMALSNPYEGERRVGTVGMPLPGVSARLEAGEIQVKGPTVFREYFGKPEATRASFTPDGWFKTGDIAELDEKGYYRILGRASQDILKSGGYKISALEIESALLEHPGVKEVAVVGLADPTWGERVAAAYVGEASGDALAAWLKERLAHYKVPSAWKRVDSLPRNAMGKVQKPLVRDSLLKSSDPSRAGGAS
jgi:malonyl-CoA/methylmalonyl-CoA synthetase